jgi:hypothetical protein
MQHHVFVDGRVTGSQRAGMFEGERWGSRARDRQVTGRCGGHGWRSVQRNGEVRSFDVTSTLWKSAMVVYPQLLNR